MKIRLQLVGMAAVFVLGVVGSLCGATPDQEESYLLRYAPKVGDKTGLDVLMDGSMDMSGVPGAPGQMDMTMTIGMATETLAVKPDGQFTTKFLMDKMLINVMGMDMDILGMIPEAKGGIEFTMVQEATGKVVKVEGLEKLAGLGGMGNMPGMDKFQQLMNPVTSLSMTVLPDRPIRLWEMWTPELPEPMAQMFSTSGAAPVRCWLCRIEDVGGSKCAKIRTRFIGSMDSEKLKQAMGEGAANVPGLSGMKMDMDIDSNVFTWLRLSDGSLLKMAGAMDIGMDMAFGGEVDDSAPIPPGGMPANFSMKMHFDLKMKMRPQK